MIVIQITINRSMKIVITNHRHYNKHKNVYKYENEPEPVNFDYLHEIQW